MSRKTLLDDVRESLPPVRTGFPAWHERLKPADLQEVEDIKAQFQAGKLATKAFTLARILSAKLQERGLANVRPQTISRWLRND